MDSVFYKLGYAEIREKLGFAPLAAPVIGALGTAARVALPWIGRGLMRAFAPTAGRALAARAGAGAVARGLASDMAPTAAFEALSRARAPRALHMTPGVPGTPASNLFDRIPQ